MRMLYFAVFAGLLLLLLLLLTVSLLPVVMLVFRPAQPRSVLQTCARSTKTTLSHGSARRRVRSPVRKMHSLAGYDKVGAHCLAVQRQVEHV